MFDSVWYYSLNRPPLTPLPTVFSTAWTILYTMIFISLVIFIAKRSSKSKALGYILFSVQMVLNLVWPYIFFNLKNINTALMIIILLDILVFLTIKEFYSFSKKSAYFLMPYFIWILFATYLNAGFLLLN